MDAGQANSALGPISSSEPADATATSSVAPSAPPPSRRFATLEEQAEHPPEDEIPGEIYPDEAPSAAVFRFAELDEAGLIKRFKEEPESLGGLSLGVPNAGALLHGVRMPDGDEWRLVDPGNAYGTQETVDYLARAIRRVHKEFPGGHPLYIGHISARAGGPLSPHKSHQAGRDVDISFYYNTEKNARWYRRGTKDTLDIARTWSFCRALISETDVELIIIDHSIQRLLREHAEQIGEDKAWLDSIFRGVAGKQRPIFLSAPGHASHIHIRFYNPTAQELARRLYPTLVELGQVKPVQQFVQYTAKRGDTLVKIAERFGTSVRSIMNANGLKNSLIRAKVTYRIPRRAGVPKLPAVRIPERRIPPEKSPGAEEGSAQQLGAAQKPNEAAGPTERAENSKG